MSQFFSCLNTEDGSTEEAEWSDEFDDDADEMTPGMTAVSSPNIMLTFYTPKCIICVFLLSSVKHEL